HAELQAALLLRGQCADLPHENVIVNLRLRLRGDHADRTADPNAHDDLLHGDRTDVADHNRVVVGLADFGGRGALPFDADRGFLPAGRIEWQGPAAAKVGQANDYSIVVRNI